MQDNANSTEGSRRYKLYSEIIPPKRSRTSVPYRQNFKHNFYTQVFYLLPQVFAPRSNPYFLCGHQVHVSSKGDKKRKVKTVVLKSDDVTATE